MILWRFLLFPVNKNVKKVINIKTIYVRGGVGFYKEIS